MHLKKLFCQFLPSSCSDLLFTKNVKSEESSVRLKESVITGNECCIRIPKGGSPPLGTQTRPATSEPLPCEWKSLDPAIVQVYNTANLARIDPPDLQKRVRFGEKLALSADDSVAVVGAPTDNSRGRDAGCVYHRLLATQ